MMRRETAANAVVALGFGLVVGILGVNAALVYDAFPPVGGPDELVAAGLAATVLGGIVIALPVYALLDRSILGWNPPRGGRD